jgi:hypothetical protein
MVGDSECTFLMLLSYFSAGKSSVRSGRTAVREYKHQCQLGRAAGSDVECGSFGLSMRVQSVSTTAAITRQQKHTRRTTQRRADENGSWLAIVVD